MVADHGVEWRIPSPFWNVVLRDPDKTALFRPTILRFADDDFMEPFMQELASSPDRLPRWTAQPETGQDQQVGWLASDDPRWQRLPFKLYQPAHHRFYLVAADLVCRTPGLPCRTIDQAQGEQVSFVIRRIMSQEPSIRREEAWLGPRHGWRPVGDAKQLARWDDFEEDRYPLFAVPFEEKSHKRRLLAGFVPVMSGAVAASPQSSPKFDPESGAHYIIRCVYERPRCKNLRPPVVSEPTRPFQIASFFDTVAPTRPVYSFPPNTMITGPSASEERG